MVEPINHCFAQSISQIPLEFTLDKAELQIGFIASNSSSVFAETLSFSLSFKSF